MAGQTPNTARPTPEAARNPSSNIILRTHRPGDIGTITLRHALLYAEAHDWPCEFESVVARICADFIDNFDPAREKLWVAEHEVTRTFQGCIMLVQDPDVPTAAKLRVLLVEPSARGAGLGTRLVDECVRFAREVGYDRITLSTAKVLEGARKLYVRAGFRLVSEEEHRMFKVPVVGETWQLDLVPRDR